jgi:hypothetical protein
VFWKGSKEGGTANERFDTLRSFVKRIRPFFLAHRHHVTTVKSLAVDLRDHLDFPPAREQVAESNAPDLRVLHIVDKGHEFVHEQLRQVGILSETKVSNGKKGKKGKKNTPSSSKRQCDASTQRYHCASP